MFCATLAAVLLAQAPAPRPAMVERSEWGALPRALAMRPHDPTRITIHHTGTPQRPDLSTAQKIKNLQLFSQREDKLADGRVKPAWGDVPYHYYIGVDGKIAVGRDVAFAGDTNTEYDPAGHVLVVVEGNFEEETLHDAQWRGLVATVWWLAQRYDVPVADIQSHRDFAKTDCPGAALTARLDALRWEMLVRRRVVREPFGHAKTAPARTPGPLGRAA